MGLFKSIGKVFGKVLKVVTFGASNYLWKKFKEWMTPDMPEKEALKVQRQGSNVSIPVVYGERIVGAIIVDKNVKDVPDGLENELFHVFAVFCHGEIDNFVEFFFNGVSWNDKRWRKDPENPASGKWFTVETRLGTTTQTAMNAVGKLNRFSATTSKYEGLACAFFTFQQDGDASIWNGEPQITARIRGKKCFDPRTGLTVFTENPALHLLDYIKSPVYGKGITDDFINLNSFTTVADICDATQTATIGTQICQTVNGVYSCTGSPAETVTFKRFTHNNIIDTDRKFFENMVEIATSFRGYFPDLDGLVAIACEKEETPVFSFSEANIVDELTSSVPGRDSRYNRVIVRFPNYKNKFQMDEVCYPEAESPLYATWLAEDFNVPQEKTVTLETVVHKAEALQIARLMAVISRNSEYVSFNATAEAIECDVGDVVNISSATRGWTNRTFRISKMVYREDDTISFEAIQHDNAIYPWVSPTYTDIIGGSNLGDPATIPAITGLAIAYDTSLTTTGRLTWNPVENAFVTSYVVTLLKGTEEVIKIDSYSPSAVIPKLDVGSYSIQVKTRTSIGTFGPTATLAFNLVTPTAPTDITFVVGNFDIEARPVLAGIGLGTEFEFAIGDTNTIRGRGMSMVFASLTPSTNYTIFARTVNSYGVSAWFSKVATTNLDQGKLNPFLTAINNAIADINNVQLPAVAGDVAALEAKFPLQGADIGTGVVTTTHIANAAISNALIADLAITAAKVSDSAITTAKIAAAAVDAGKIATGAVGATHIASLAVTAGKIAANAVTATEIASGAVTTAKIASSAVTATQIASLAVTTAKIAASAIDATKLADLAVTTGKLAASAVDSTKLADGAVLAAKLADNAVTTAKVAAAAIDAGKIALGAVGTTHLANLAVTADKVNAAAITTDKIAAGAVATGNIAAGAVTGNELADLAVSSTKVADNAITNAKIVAGAIDAGKIATGAVGTTQLADLAITSAKVSDNAVTTAKIAAGAVSTAKIAAGAVTATELANLAVTAAKVADSAVTTAKIAAGAVDAGKLADAAVTRTKLGVQVGGGNLCHDSSFEDTTGGGWVTYNNSGGGTASFRYDTGRANGRSRVQVVGGTPGTTFGVFKPDAVEGNWQTGVPYIVSFYAKMSAGATMTSCRLEWNNSPQTVVELVNPNKTTEWQRYVFLVQWNAGSPVPSLNGRGSLWINTRGTWVAGDEYWIDDVQVEQADVVSAYAPRPNEILTGTIGTTLISDNAVTSAKIIAGAITAGKIAAGVVTATEIASNTITANQLAAEAVTASRIATGTITATQLAAGAVTAGKIAANAVTATEIAANAVTTSRIAAGAVTASQIAANTITASNIAANTITAAQIATGTLTAGVIASNAITADKIATDAVTSDKILANAITSAKIATGAITAGKIAAGSISATEIAAGAITADNIATNTITASKLVITDQSNLLSDPQLIDSDSWGPLTSFDGFGDSATEAPEFRSRRFMKFIGAANAYRGFNGSRWVPVEPGVLYYVAFQSRVVSGTGRCLIYMQFADNEGGANAVNLFYTPNSSTTVTEVSTTFTPPAGKRVMRVIFYKDLNGATEVWMGGPILRRMTSSELIVDGAVVASKIAAGAVTADKILAGAVTAGKVAANAITATELATGSVTAGKVAASAITATAIASGAITTAKIAAGAVTTNELAAGAVTAAKITAGTITATELAAGAVTTAKIAAGAITANEIAAGTITASKLMITNSGAALNDDPGFTDLAAWVLSSPNITRMSNPGGAGVGQYYVSASTTTDQFAECAKFYACDAAKVYKLSAMLYAASGNNRDFYLYVDFYNGAGTLLASTSWGGTKGGYVYGGQPTVGDWRRCGGQFGAGTSKLIPTTAKLMKIGVWLQYSGTGTSAVQQAANDIRLEECASADLIVDGAIIASKVAAGAITAGKIAADAVTASTIAAGAVVAGKIAANAVTATELAAGAVTAAKILAGTITATELASSSITSDKIAASAVTSGSIAAGAVIAGKIGANAVTATEISAGAITTAKIAAGAVTATELASGSVTTAKLVASAITANEIASNAVTTAKIAANAVTATQIAANAITAAKVSAGAITASKITISGGGAINRDPMLQDADAYIASAGSFSFQTITDAPVGNVVLRSGGTTQAYVNDRFAYAIDTSKKYRVRFWARSAAGTNGTLYFCLRQFSTPATPCATNSGRAPYKVSAAVASTSWVEHSVEYTVPGDWQAGVKFVYLDWLLNHSGSAGYMEICFPRFEEMAPADLIVDGAISTAKLAANAVTATQIAAGAITTAKLAAGAVTANELAANAVTAAKIAALTITADKIAANTITGDKIAANTITAAQIAAGTITGDKFFANAIDTAILSSGGIDVTNNSYQLKLLTATRPIELIYNQERVFSVNPDGSGFYKGGLADNTVGLNAITNEARRSINPYYTGATETRAFTVPATVSAGGAASLTAMTQLQQGDKVGLVFRFADSADFNEVTAPQYSDSTYTAKVQRSIGGGAWTDVPNGSRTFTVFGYYYPGTSWPEPETPSSGYYYDTSLTVTDDVPTTSASIQYRVLLTLVSGGTNTNTGCKLTQFTAEKSGFVKNTFGNTGTVMKWVDKESGFTVICGNVTVNADSSAVVNYGHTLTTVISAFAQRDFTGYNDWTVGSIAAGTTSATVYNQYTTGSLKWCVLGFTTV